MPAQTDRLNTALAGRYRIERHLGEGGMASVYLAEDLKHDRKVALKLLKPELAAVLGAERFVVEIKTTAALQHPHILPLFDSGTADSFLFYVMPFIEGETLREKLNRETQLGVDEAVRIAREVLDALEYAHQHGIVHRDVKPENILLHGGHAMVADFGIALAVSAAAGGRMTETGLSLGTPHYMSPEQATAEKEITPRSDIYSLGAVLYEMLSGSPPHVGASAQQIVMKIIAEPVQPVTALRPSVPPNVAGAVAKALERVPADRFESAKAFSEALANPAYTNATFVGTAAHADSGKPSVLTRPLIATMTLATALLVAALWGWLRPMPTVVSHQRIVLLENQQIRPGFVGRALAISPDGGTVVFIDSTAAGWQLYAKERDRVDATALSGTIGVRGAPTFSPDGAWIAFKTVDGKVKKVPRLGGSAIAIADSASSTGGLAWLDGGTVLYVDAGFGVRAVAQDGGTPRQVFDAAHFSQSDTTSRFAVSVTGLPGGHAALLTACTIACVTSDLRVLDLRSLKVTVLQDQALQGWALPGGDVAFVRRDGGVFAAPFNMNRLAFTKAPTPVMDGVRTSLATADFAVSANGTAVYVAGAAGISGARYQPVWVTRTGTAAPIDSAWTIPLTRSGCTCDGGMALSPDGRRLAVSIWRVGVASSSGDIYVKQLDQAPFTFTPLTFAGDNMSPTWTADGRSVVYSGSKGNEMPALWLLRRRADGTGVVDTLLRTRTRDIVEVVPTHDTTEFILRLNQGGPLRDIVLARRGDTTTTPLVADSTFGEVEPALSPDGRWLAYVSDETGHYEVYVRPFPDVNAHRWQVSQAGGTQPRWAHSGRELFFWNGAGGVVAVSVVPGATLVLGTQTLLFDASRFLGNGNHQARGYDVALGDQRFVFLRKVEPTGPAGQPPIDKLVQITNWAAEVQAKLAGKAPK